MSGEAITLGAVRRMAVRRLAAAFGSDGTPALDARLLIAAVLGIEANNLVLADYRTVTMAEMERIDAYLERRLAGEPVARILGAKEFWGLSFALSPDTLVPRPDTETLVEVVLAYFERRGGPERALRVVDIGTGSGAILVALFSALPNILGLGVDLSEGAARMARDNAERLGFGERGLFVCGSFGEMCGGADVIVSNPPYIQSDIIDTLSPEVRDYDPRLALDGGADGLDAYRVLIADLERLMAPEGAAFFEIGYDQAEAVSELATHAGFGVTLHRDLAGHDRVVEIGRLSAAF